MLRFFFSVFAIAMIVSVPARAVMEDYPSVKLQGLDKSTARTTTFEAKVGSTITYGPLFVRIQACRKAPPIEKPESAAFIQIWEVPPETGKSEWVFSGWMFASSPALSAMDHPVYDLWVLDCSGREEPNAEAKQSETDATTSQEDLTAPTGTDGSADAAPSVQDDVAPVVDSEAQDQTPIDTDSGAAPADHDVSAPTTPAPGVPFDPSAPPVANPVVDPDAPYVPAPLPGQAQPQPAPVTGGDVPVDPDAPYVPAPLPGQTGAPQAVPSVPAHDYDAPYSPNRAYPSQQ